MPKIKISSKIEEIEGEIINGKVSPFGTSAHIPFSKKHTGKYIKIIVPEEAEYCWVFSDRERKEFVKSCLKELEEKPSSRLTFHIRDSIKRLNEKKFGIEDLNRAIRVLEDNNKYDSIVNKIKKTYNLK